MSNKRIIYMLASSRKYGSILLLFVLASIGAFIGGCTAWLYFILYIWADKNGSHIANVAEAQDRVLAAQWFGCSGRHTVSIEAAFAQRKYLNLVRAALAEADPEHVIKAVFNDGAYCRISDHKDAPGGK